MKVEMFPNDNMPPTTQSVAFFQGSLLLVGQWLLSELTQSHMKWVRRHLDTLDPDSLLHLLHPPASVGVTRYLLVSIGENWTAVLNNSRLGTDVGMMPSIAARKMRLRAIRATAVPDSQDRFGATILEVYEPTAGPPLACRRTISAANDGGKWRFDQYGEPFPFEDTTSYARKRTRDRFTREMLHTYLARLGVPPRVVTSLAQDSVLFLEGPV